MGIKLKQSPSGKELVGTVNGQVPVWNNTTKLWEAGAGVPSNPLVIGPGIAGTVVECSFAPGADLLMPAFNTLIYVPVMTGDCAYRLLNTSAQPGSTIGFFGPFTGGLLTVRNAADVDLFGMLDPGGHWGVAVYTGAEWVRYASGI